jgi:Mrp family chromosome partitioning ATPase
MGLLRSPQTAVHVVTLLEEMPVQETADAVAELTDAGLPVGGIVVNGVRTPMLKQADLTAAAKGRLDREVVAAGLEAAGVRLRESAVDALLAEAAGHAQRVALEKSERRTLRALGRPTYDLPLLSDGVDLGGLYALAEKLCRQGMA